MNDSYWRIISQSTNHRPRPKTGENCGLAQICSSCLVSFALRLDLPIGTAARLSATFPYISPVTRGNFLPDVRGELHTFHFGDGGYYDNDGVATAEEFLWFATKLSPQVQTPILLVQIRDSAMPGPPGSVVLDVPDNGGWSTLCDLFAPLATLYNAGHVANTERNQRQLAVLGEAIKNKTRITTLILDYSTPDSTPSCQSAAAPPGQKLKEINRQKAKWSTLNWELSRADMKEIDDRVDQLRP